MSNWIREAISDGQSGRVSSKRVAMLMASFALSVSVISLSVAALMGYSVALELGAVSVPLAGLGGYSYVGGKSAEIKREQS